MRLFHIGLLCVAIAAGLGAAPASAEQYRLCIRGQSYAPGREFLQTRQLQLQAEGPAPGELLLPMATRAVREKLWPELQADEVQVARFDPLLCGSEAVAELTLSYSASDLQAIRPELARGPGDQPRLADIARQSSAKPAVAEGPPAGTPAHARRYDWVRLYYATTRQATGAKKAADAFGSARSDELNFGMVEVSIPADHRWARLESPSKMRLEWDTNPDRHVTLGDRFQALSAADLRADLARLAGGFSRAGVLVFIHGYRNSFAESAQRAAQLAYDLAFPGPTLVFSWPSDGDLRSYVRDEEKARTAWRQMAQVLDQLTTLGPDIPVFAIAHSMGNRVLTQGLAELLRQRPGADRALRQVVLAAPDIGQEEFRQRWIYELKSASAPRYTLYASNQDLPLALSDWLHGEPRLGAGGRNIALLAGLDSIDASAITREWFGLSHAYFGDNESVMNDLFLLINRGLAPDQRPRLRKVRDSRGDYWEFKP
ncbi:MAG: alpha/beta hydrolase [Proteobacteria bacterium]|nr:alpha/beta hydrolase [Pseudomonadota bacterium]